jgi:hypothetical protein
MFERVDVVSPYMDLTDRVTALEKQIASRD